MVNPPNVPTVKFGLLSEAHFVTDYIQVNNPHLREVADKIKGRSHDDVIGKCALYVARHVKYAVGQDNNPCASRHVQIFKYRGPLYLVDHECQYGWLMPNQLLKTGYGICFDSAVLCCTLMRLKELNACVVLGAVLTPKRRNLKGFHAWVEVIDVNNRVLVVETTSPKKPSLFLDKDVYGPKGTLPHLYDPVCRFNESTWQEDTLKSQAYVELALNALKRKGPFILRQ